LVFVTENGFVLCEVGTESINVIWEHVIHRKSVPRLRWLVAGLSLQRHVFDPASCHVSFVADKAAMGQVSLRLTRFFPVSIIPSVHIHLHLHVAFTRRTNGRRLGALEKPMIFRKSGNTGYKISCIFLYFKGRTMV
jgi:hypothetical protein